jgi:hypothetical protein
VILLAVEIAQAAPSERVWNINDWPLPVRWACWYAVILLVVLMGVQSDAQFIYFQF